MRELLRQRGNWCVVLLLVLAGAGCAPSPARGPQAAARLPAPLVRYWMVSRAEPRPLRIHHLKVDLADSRLELAAALAADPDGDGPATAQLTPPVELARQAGALALVNANPWRSLADQNGQRNTNWHEGMAVEILGLACAGGVVRSAAEDPEHCSVWLDEGRRLHIGGLAAGEKPCEGVAGFARLLAGGQVLHAPGGPIHPRTALGMDAAGRYVYLVVVDGRQAGYSEGMTYQELAAYMRELGCADAVNLDGGGSSIMLLAEGEGRYRVVNDPSTKVAGLSVARPIPVALVVRLRARGPGEK